MQHTTAAPTLLDVLALEEIDRDLYRSNLLLADGFRLYGGQVAAQALQAAGLTVPDDRLPHSLHGYFLRGGAADRPTIFRVSRDRDGRSFSARRVVAVQGGEVIFNMSASFHVREDGVDDVRYPPIDAPDPDTLAPTGTGERLLMLETRPAPSPFGETEWPTRAWARSPVPLGGDPLLNASALTYLSDMYSGLAPLHTDRGRSAASLDHAVWFHRPVRMDEWVLMDLVPHIVGAGRGFYSGTMRDRDGRVVASLTQEALFRAARS